MIARVLRLRVRATLYPLIASLAGCAAAPARPTARAAPPAVAATTAAPALPPLSRAACADDAGPALAAVEVRAPSLEDCPFVGMDMGQSVARVCADLDGDLERRIRLAERGIPRPARGPLRALLQPFNHCHPGPGGWWFQRVDDLAARWVNDPGAAGADGGRWEIEVVWRLGYVTGEGPAYHAAGDARRERLGSGATAAFAPVWLHDWDHDGHQEIVFVQRDAPRGPAYELFTLHDGAIVPFSAPVDDLVAIADVDNDRQHDLVLASSYTLRSPCERAPWRGVAELAHALDDGSFSMNDAVATAFARQGCRDVDPEAPLVRATAGGDALDGAQTARAIACASLRGATASQLAARLRAEYARVPAAVREASACVPLDAMLAEAETPRPFTLRDRCAGGDSP